MAMDWIKFEHHTLDKPEMYEIAHILKVSHEHAIVLCLRWWVWLDKNTHHGNVTHMPLLIIDSLTNAPGFGAALCAVGWLEKRGDDAIVTPNFFRHNLKTAKTRALSARRSLEYRTRGRHDSVTPTVTHPSRTPRDQQENLKSTPKGPPEHQQPGGAPGANIYSLDKSKPIEPAPPEPKQTNNQRRRPRANGTNPRANGTNPRATGSNPRARRGPPQWWASDAGVQAMGHSMGLDARPGESAEAYAARVQAAIDAKAKAGKT